MVSPRRCFNWGDAYIRNYTVIGQGWVSSLQHQKTSNTLSAITEMKVLAQYTVHIHCVSPIYQSTSAHNHHSACLLYYFQNFLHYLCHCHKQDKCFTDSSEIVQRFRICVELVIRQVWSSSNGKSKGQNYHFEEVEEQSAPVWIMVTTLPQVHMYQI